MHLKIDPKIFEAYPGLKLGVILIKKMDNSRRISSVESLLRGVCAQRMKEFQQMDINEHEMIKPWNEAYGKFGINPKKNPPSIAALLKRLQEGKEIPHLSPLVDLYNYFSLKYLLPIGGEDLDWLCGDLQLTFTEGGEAFRAIGSIDVKEANAGEVAYMDDGGITCRYWNHRECERTKFTNKTVNAAIIIEDLSGMSIDAFGQILKEVQGGLIRYIGGQIEPYILTEKNSQVDLGIEGRKTCNDAKVPQQEKAFFLSKQGLKLEPQEVEELVIPDIVLPVEDDELSKKKLQKLIEGSLQKAYPDLEGREVVIEYPKDETHGDYACNIAMILSKELQQNPREIAQKIVENIPANSLVSKVEIAGPGFINMFLSPEVLHYEISKILVKGSAYGRTKVGNGQTVIVEYSSPNIAKPMGAHHLMTTVIGQSLYNIFDAIGYKSLSINHIGDWGTQFGKLIYAYKQWGSREDLEKAPIDEMLKLYIKFHDEAEKEPSLEDAARYEFKIFEEGDPENRKLWEWFVAESMKEIQKAYDKLGNIHFDKTQGESFYEDKMEAIITEGKNLGIFIEGEEGALIVKYPDPNIPPFVIQKKDGATLYSTRDLAALKYRIQELNPSKILYVVDTAQSLHFKQLFGAASRFAWYNGQAHHVSFGRMRMKDAGMSTRKGNIILMEDLLNEAIKRAKTLITEKNPNLTNPDEVAEKLGVGAVKYSILSQNRTTDIVFDWDKMLSFESNSAAYLQYSYARGRSILRKSHDAIEEPISDPMDAFAKSETLIRTLAKFSEHIAIAARDYKPNVMTNYLYDLAQKFNSFYNSVPVLKAASDNLKDERLKLVEATTQILKNGLNLLGIDVPEEM